MFFDRSHIYIYKKCKNFKVPVVKPRFSQKKNPALFLEHRKNFFNGEIVSEFSGTIENNKKEKIN